MTPPYITPQRAFTTAKEYIVMTIGMFIYSFGWIGCVLPAKSTGGAASGLAIVISTALDNAYGWDLRIGTIVLAINAVLLIVAGFVLGWNFGLKTIWCILMLSFSMNMWQEILPAEDFLHLDRFLSMVLGGVVTGFGVALALMQGGSAGGTDIVAMIINKYRTISYGRIVIAGDFVIIGCSLFVASDLATGIATVIYGYIMVAVYGYTVDLIQSGNQQSSQIFIISNDYESIATAINNEAHRGVTIIDGMGWYTHKSCKIVMAVCRKRDASMILKIAKRVDPDAFITMGSVMGVYGKGFEALSKI